MTEVTVFTADRMLAIENATVIDGQIIDGFLILTTRGGTEINAGQALGGPGIPPSASEVAYWQDQAALLDPDAYEYVQGASFTRTVPSGETWYMVNGWQLLPSAGGGPYWFHRPADVNRALSLPEDTEINGSTNPNAFAYICKPSLVVSGDDRYTDNPKELYFSRMRRLQSELERFQIGAAATGSGTTLGVGQIQVDFPTDFTRGFVVQTSAHDVAWAIMQPGGLNTHNEISDDDPFRWAEPTPFPFLLADFDSILIQGCGSADGCATMTYVKLPSDW